MNVTMPVRNLKEKQGNTPRQHDASAATATPASREGQAGGAVLASGAGGTNKSPPGPPRGPPPKGSARFRGPPPQFTPKDQPHEPAQPKVMPQGKNTTPKRPAAMATLGTHSASHAEVKAAAAAGAAVARRAPAAPRTTAARATSLDGDMLGSFLVIETVHGETHSGELWCYDHHAGIVVLRLTFPNGTCNWTMLKQNNIKSIEARPELDKNPHEKLPQIDLVALDALAQRANQDFQNNMNQLGSGVTSEAQFIFDRLHKTMACEWVDGQSIKCFSVMIHPPYSPDECHGENAKELQRVQRIVLGINLEMGRKFHSGFQQQPKSDGMGSAPPPAEEKPEPSPKQQKKSWKMVASRGGTKGPEAKGPGTPPKVGSKKDGGKLFFPAMAKSQPKHSMMKRQST